MHAHREDAVNMPHPTEKKSLFLLFHVQVANLQSIYGFNDGFTYNFTDKGWKKPTFVC
jgi:hypothetical protein